MDEQPHPRKRQPNDMEFIIDSGHGMFISRPSLIGLLQNDEIIFLRDHPKYPAVANYINNLIKRLENLK
jgi:hypothetical protein